MPRLSREQRWLLAEIKRAEEAEAANLKLWKEKYPTYLVQRTRQFARRLEGLRAVYQRLTRLTQELERLGVRRIPR